MTEQLTATLTRIREKGETAGAGDVVTVQFNPASLKLARQGTQNKAGTTTKGQDVQYPSTQPATLNLDLEFDTAEDWAAADAPVDVRTRTDPLRAFLEPPKDKPAGAPPRVRFQWGVFLFLGIVTQISEEFDYFAPNGTPLRAKVALALQEQDPALEAGRRGPGARTDGGKTTPGATPTPAPADAPLPGAAPGRSGTATPLSAASALAGESVQQLAARLGGDPAAWRALMNGLDSPTGLAAGTPVEVGPELTQSAGLGAAAGFAATAGESPTAALAGVLGPGRAGAARGPAAGVAVAAAGGIGAAVARVAAGAQARAEAAARGGFAVPAGRAGPEGAGPDPRAATFGRGVPLRARAHPPTVADDAAGGSRSVAARARPVELPTTGGGAVPPWVDLPPASAGRRSGDGGPHRISPSAGGCR